MKIKYLIPALIFLGTLTNYAQTAKCNCGDQEAYDAFVKEEKHQFVTEGEDAKITIWSFKKNSEDLILTYKITGDNINSDIIIPEIQTLIIPKGETEVTLSIPTISDHISEVDETFTFELLGGTTAVSKKKLRNLKLIRTRTIVDAKSTEDSIVFFVENGVVKTEPAYSTIEVRNINGIVVDNNNIKSGIYYIKAKINNKTITKKYGVTE